MVRTRMSKARAEQVLKLSGSYTLDTVRSSYRTLAKRYHPDLAKEADDPQELVVKMAQLNEAKSTIEDIFNVSRMSELTCDRRRSSTSCPSVSCTWRNSAADYYHEQVARNERRNLMFQEQERVFRYAMFFGAATLPLAVLAGVLFIALCEIVPLIPLIFVFVPYQVSYLLFNGYKLRYQALTEELC